jgi:hypothetical protein
MTATTWAHYRRRRSASSAGYTNMPMCSADPRRPLTQRGPGIRSAGAMREAFGLRSHLVCLDLLNINSFRCYAILTISVNLSLRLLALRLVTADRYQIRGYYNRPRTKSYNLMFQPTWRSTFAKLAPLGQRKVPPEHWCDLDELRAVDPNLHLARCRKWGRGVLSAQLHCSRLSLSF